jgi:DNA-binding NtrC family response regulator
VLREARREAISAALRASENNPGIAARRLGITEEDLAREHAQVRERRPSRPVKRR